MPAKLTEAEIQEALIALPGWSYRDGSLVKKFPFRAYMDGIRFVETIAVDSEARDHHPDLLVRHTDVTVFLSTHSASGITARDLDSARSVDAIAVSMAG